MVRSHKLFLVSFIVLVVGLVLGGVYGAQALGFGDRATAAVAIAGIFFCGGVGAWWVHRITR